MERFKSYIANLVSGRRPRLAIGMVVDRCRLLLPPRNPRPRIAVDMGHEGFLTQDLARLTFRAGCGTLKRNRDQSSRVDLRGSLFDRDGGRQMLPARRNPSTIFYFLVVLKIRICSIFFQCFFSFHPVKQTAKVSLEHSRLGRQMLNIAYNQTNA